MSELPALTRLPTTFFPSPNEADTKESRPRSIVVAYDHSNYGDAMIAKAIRLGILRTTDDICLLHIINQTDFRHLFSPMLSANETSTDYGVMQDDDMVTASDAILWEIINVLKKHGFQHVKSEVLRGDPKESITDFCRLTKPLYLLTGSRGLGVIKRTMMGSVSNYLIRHCSCAVLVLKLDPEEIEERKALDENKKNTFSDVLAKLVKK
ncbi:hypothetical protein BDB01DRAFT_908490 [Pilobolus umbonatus]|nr:hypothetical protein BDB01DRAFT_908490 [Pilobolus umbonatus]